MLATLWLPALGWGFSSDDFDVLGITGWELLDDPFALSARPIELLTYAAVPTQASANRTVTLLIYLACIGLMYRLCRRMALDTWSTFVALTAFFHPAFLWSVTSIGQRPSLLVTFFLLASITATGTLPKLALIAMCSATRTPYIFQNLVFSWQFARRQQRIASTVPLLCMCVFGVAGYVAYYNHAVSGNTIASEYIPLAVSLPLRMAKLIEGVVYVFAPIPVFAVARWAPIAAFIVYLSLWFVVARSLLPFRAALREHGGIPAMALTMCIPFVFATEVRLTMDAAVLTFLAVACFAQWRRAGKIATVGILALNLTGIGLNYTVFRSAQYDLSAGRIAKDYSQPAYIYQAWREQVRHRILTGLGVNASVRPLEW